MQLLIYTVGPHRGYNVKLYEIIGEFVVSQPVVVKWQDTAKCSIILRFSTILHLLIIVTQVASHSALCSALFRHFFNSGLMIVAVRADRFSRAKTRHATYLWHNIEAYSCNYCYGGEAMSITQIMCVFVALGTQHAMRMHQIVIYGLSLSTKFFHIIS
jgi:hypothetical protein